MNKNANRFLTAFLLLLCYRPLTAQADCILGLGVEEDSTLATIFQLNPGQTEKMVRYSAELKYRNGLLDTRLGNIRKRLPQSTEQELSQLAIEYNVMMDSMQLVQAMMEKRLLTLFNQKQYTLYRNLCLEASRSPFVIVPAIYRDTSVVKKRASFLDNLDRKN